MLPYYHITVEVLCRKDNMKITIQQKPDYVISHVEKSDLNSNRGQEHNRHRYSKSIVHMACTL